MIGQSISHYRFVALKFLPDEIAKEMER